MVCSLSFHFLNTIFCRAKDFHFDKVQLTDFFPFVYHTFGVYLRTLSRSQWFSTKNFIVLCVIFKPKIFCEVWDWGWDQFFAHPWAVSWDHLSSTWVALFALGQESRGLNPTALPRFSPLTSHASTSAAVSCSHLISSEVGCHSSHSIPFQSGFMYSGSSAFPNKVWNRPRHIYTFFCWNFNGHCVKLTHSSGEK